MTDRAPERAPQTDDRRPSNTSNEIVVLCVPADTRHASTARVVAASLAADLGFDVDQIDDLRLGVNEAVALVVDAVTAAAPGRSSSPLLEITFASVQANGTPTLEIEVGQRWTSGDDGDGEPGSDDTGPVAVEFDDLADRILSAVVDRHSQAHGTVRLTSSRRPVS